METYYSFTTYVHHYNEYKLPESVTPYYTNRTSSSLATYLSTYLLY